MEHYRAPHHCGLIEAIIAIVVLVVGFLVVYLAGYHLGEFNTLKRYAEQGMASQTMPLQIIPDDEMQEINYIHIHHPCRIYIELEE